MEALCREGEADPLAGGQVLAGDGGILDTQGIGGRAEGPQLEGSGEGVQALADVGAGHVAVDAQGRVRGMMAREAFPDQGGMLFVFPEASLSGYFLDGGVS